VFVFGVGIRLAGTLSLLISLPTILRGLYRQFTLGTVLRGRDDAVGLALPMAAGSAVGALGGGLLVAHVAGPAIKLLLGLILMASAIRIFSTR
jgi:uncharacterized membrane protein YfcA